MTECCESIIRMDVRGETVSDRRSAEQKSRAPSEILQQVTDRRLTEVDCRVLRGVCHWTRLAKYGGGVTSIYCFMCHCGNFEFNTIVNRQPVLFT